MGLARGFYMFFSNVSAYKCRGSDTRLVSISHGYCLIALALQDDGGLWPHLLVNGRFTVSLFSCPNSSLLFCFNFQPCWCRRKFASCNFCMWLYFQLGYQSESWLFLIAYRFLILALKNDFFFFFLTYNESIQVAQQAMLLNTYYPNISLRSLGTTRPKHPYMVFSFYLVTGKQAA